MYPLFVNCEISQKIGRSNKLRLFQPPRYGRTSGCTRCVGRTGRWSPLGTGRGTCLALNNLTRKTNQE